MDKNSTVLDKPNAQPEKLNWLGSSLLVIGVSLLSYLSYVYAPSTAASAIMKSTVTELAIEWHDEISELRLLKGQYYSGAIPPNEQDELWLRNLARASGINQIELFDSQLNLQWSSDLENRILGSITLTENEIKKSDRYREPKVSILAPSENFFLNYTQRNNEEFSEKLLSNNQVSARVLIPEIRYGNTIGFLEINYDISLAYQRYKSTIQMFVIVLSALSLILILTLIIFRYIIAKKTRNTMKKVNKKERELRASVDRSNIETQAIRELAECLQISSTLSESYMLVQTFLEQTLPEYSGSLYILNDNNSEIELVKNWPLETKPVLERINHEDCWALRKGRAFQYGKGVFEFNCNHQHMADAKYYMCLPVLANGSAIGILSLLPKKQDAIPNNFDNDLRLANACVEQMGMSLANLSLRNRLEQQSLRDPLTHLYNRRGLAKIFEETCRFNSKIFVAMLDLDHFKSFNDKYGHDAGDLVLVEVAKLIDHHSKGHAFRLGGEEMAILVTDIEETACAILLEKVRSEMNALNISFNGTALPKISASFGVAEFSIDGKDLTTLLKVADLALYRAKESGRNRVEWANGHEITPKQNTI